MKLSELTGKEVINMCNGTRLGIVGDSDLLIDAENGEVESIILPPRNNILSIWTERSQMVIPWTAVKKVGSEVIVVEVDQTHPRRR